MKITSCQSQNTWPNVLILGSIHGNERSGSLAIEQFRKKIQTKEIRLLSGSITLISDCNEEAGRRNLRYVESNLNRCFYDWQALSSYEGAMAREIMPFFEGKTHLLDLHSTSGPSAPFLFSEKKNLEIARKLWIPYVITGWNDLESSSVAWDTENYMNKKGWCGFTFESWNHNSPEGAQNAYQVLLNFLSSLWIIDSHLFNNLPWEKKVIKMTHVYACKTNEFLFSLSKQELVNFSPISAGTLIGIDGSEEIRAKNDSIFIMPNLTKVKKWEDVFFIGQTVE